MLKILSSEWISFSVQKIENTSVAWINTPEYTAIPENCRGDVYNDFLQKFSYGISGTPCFKDLTFDQNDNQNLLAERYGGHGVAFNGGGVRCGTLSGTQYQLKGIGTNCLVGNHDDYNHSYGGLDAPLAIAEVIYTNVFEKIVTSWNC